MAELSRTGLTFALDQLFAGGYVPTSEGDGVACDDGRRCPSAQHIHEAFAQRGLLIDISLVPLFGIWKAMWRHEGDNVVRGSVVGTNEMEAGTFALALLLRSERAMNENAVRNEDTVQTELAVDQAIHQPVRHAVHQVVGV